MLNYDFPNVKCNINLYLLSSWILVFYCPLYPQRFLSFLTSFVLVSSSHLLEEAKWYKIIREIEVWKPETSEMFHENITLLNWSCFSARPHLLWNSFYRERRGTVSYLNNNNDRCVLMQLELSAMMRIHVKCARILLDRLHGILN